MTTPPGPGPLSPGQPHPSAADRRRWRQYLADEQAEAATYRYLAERREGEERDILLALADAEGRHEEHWRQLLGPEADKPGRPSFRNRVLGLLARRFGSVFVLALAQRAEGRSPYSSEPSATSAMAADEQIHEEVVRGLATRGRIRLSGNFRAAIFGANDGLVSNLALVMGIGATGVSSGLILFSGILGLLAGALSMGAGEYVSVRSQRELLEASKPTQVTLSAAKSLDIDANELVLVYRARGMSREAAEHRAAERLGLFNCDCDPSLSLNPEQEEEASTDANESVGTGLGTATSSFCFFSSGAIIPVLPYIFGMTGISAVVLSCVLVSLALLLTGSVVGLLSGASPLKRALRQLAIGLGAAAATYLLGTFVGTGTV
ncbi:VIT1/CCC1 transporter family protein [Arthrobacter sp. Sa2BUA2]|uniref:VIT1/CCC1 transporter family protein n=1 Tax=Arthrobacter pullicola TaxID=2762224 RepID=A0ABR8YLK8_9MICC|nr:VIT1/CCC1 transporter family protein [Arthrobacter pullicola]MBD8045127.1 VIT1/CCC1 transporter family protein [Arthrobacter pullicola]